MRSIMTDRAWGNLDALAQNTYPGRGLAVGMDETEQFLVQAYWIMGRSPNSRNRVFKSDKDKPGRLFTEPANPAKVQDASLIIYNAMMDDPKVGIFVVSNGHQTDSVFDGLMRRYSFKEALTGQKYEPDAPNFTPRITAASYLKNQLMTAEISIIKKAPFDETCQRHFFSYEHLEPGIGLCLHTYSGDGEPLPSFNGEPFALPFEGDAEQIAETIWDDLDRDNRVSLAVKTIARSSGASRLHIINKYMQA